MRRLYKFIVLLLFLPLLMGMGSMFGESPGKIPEPEKKFTATFIDQMDITALCTEVSIEGETILEGTHGKGVYTVSFDKIENVIFYLKNGELTGKTILRDGSTVSLVLKKDSMAYGRTKYGTFNIKLSDLKKIIIYPRPEEGSKKDKNH
ncbi:MAG: hypothetical protein Q7J27_05880 [Syntrophales bacterium]|nr:hypothetical protein [Syntrophales bacterium]